MTALISKISDFQFPRSVRRALALGAYLTLSGSVGAVTSIVDSFSNDDLATNPDAGSGFQLVSNPVLEDGTAVESGTQVLINTSGQQNDNTGIVSMDTLTVGATDTVTVFWDIASASNLIANGIELTVQGGTDFRAESYLNLRVKPNGNAGFYINSNTAIVSDATTLSQALDGFTLTLTANAAGWSITNTGYASFADLSGGYGTSSFLGIFNGGRLAATVQGTGATGTMRVNQITATVIPEPSAGLLLGFVSAVFLARRRRA